MIEEIRIVFDKENGQITTFLRFDGTHPANKRSFFIQSGAKKDFINDDGAKIEMSGIFIEDAYDYFLDMEKK